MLRYTLISSAVMWCVCDPRSPVCPSHDILLQCDPIQSCSCGICEPVVNTQEISLLAFLLERIRDEVLVIPFFLPVAVAVGTPFLDVVIGNRKEVKSVLEVSLVFCRIISQEVTACAVDNADVPVRQTYFALCFGVTSSSSHSSMFPAALITFCDSLLKRLNCRCC